MDRKSKIYVSGHSGMVGSALMRKLKADGYTGLIARTPAQLDLTDQAAVRDFFRRERPEYVFLAAAAVGGIKKNMECPADMLRINLAIETNVIESSFLSGVKRLMFFASSCIYPRLCPQPMKEEYLLTGPFEPTNEGYAIAKLAGLRLCEYYNRQYKTDFLSVIPCNLYGIGDHYDENAHVLASLISRFYLARKSGAESVSVWGTGGQRREFLFADDMADAAVFLMNIYNESGFLNLGSGEDMSVRELAELIARIVGYTGKIGFDTSRPDGMPRKLLDVSRLCRMGWRPAVSLEEGIRRTLNDYLGKHPELR